MNIKKLIDIIWKNPNIEDDLGQMWYLMDLVWELTFLNTLSMHLNNGTLDEWLNEGEKSASNEISENKINELKEIIICFYLSKYRLDDLLYWPKELRDNQLNKIIKIYELNKEKLLSIYLNWQIIENAINKLLYDTTTE